MYWGYLAAWHMLNANILSAGYTIDSHTKSAQLEVQVVYVHWGLS